MADLGKRVGDGQSSPLGDGSGKQGGGGKVANNFVENPGGAKSGGAKPRSFVQPAPEKSGQGKAKPEGGTGSVAPGTTAAQDVTPSQDAGNPIGVGSLGSGAKPFKLGG